ncbi:MAG: hypothetical protein ACE5G1_05800 [bacterium]
MTDRYLKELGAEDLPENVMKAVRALKDEVFQSELVFINSPPLSGLAEERYKSTLLKHAVFSINFTDKRRYPFTSVSKTVLYEDLVEKIWSNGEK